jgi:hypothetical protein
MNPLPADWTINIAIWAVIWSAIAVWQVVTVRSPGLPSFASVIRLARRSWFLRWVLLLFWVWLGWHIFVRTHF